MLRLKNKNDVFKHNCCDSVLKDSLRQTNCFEKQ